MAKQESAAERFLTSTDDELENKSSTAPEGQASDEEEFEKEEFFGMDDNDDLNDDDEDFTLLVEKEMEERKKAQQSNQDDEEDEEDEEDQEDKDEDKDNGKKSSKETDDWEEEIEDPQWKKVAKKMGIKAEKEEDFYKALEENVEEKKAIELYKDEEEQNRHTILKAYADSSIEEIATYELYLEYQAAKESDPDFEMPSEEELRAEAEELLEDKKQRLLYKNKKETKVRDLEDLDKSLNLRKENRENDAKEKSRKFRNSIKSALKEQDSFADITIPEEIRKKAYQKVASKQFIQEVNSDPKNLALLALLWELRDEIPKFIENAKTAGERHFFKELQNTEERKNHHAGRKTRSGDIGLRFLQSTED